MLDPRILQIKRRLLRTKDLPKKCMYCGDPASEKEHVYPQSIFRNNTPIVWACQECNGIAGARVFESIEEKREFIKRELRKKYAFLFRVPEWDEEEIAELGIGMRSWVLSARRAKEWIVNRLTWDKTAIALIVEKLLENRASGNAFAAKLAALTPTELREMRRCASIEESAIL